MGLPSRDKVPDAACENGTVVLLIGQIKKTEARLRNPGLYRR